MKLIKIIAQLNPFSTDKSIFEFESDTVSNLLKKIDTNKAVNTGWRVMIDDQIITDFETVVPAGSTVYVKLVPEGDSPEETGAKAGVWVGVVSAIAGAILLFIPGFQLFGGLLLGVGCVMFTGAGYAYVDIQQQKNQNKEKPESDPSIRGSQNQSRPMQQIPTLLGRRRIYPDLIMTPYTEVDSSGNQYLCQLFCAGQKDQKIDTSSIKIEETLLKDYSTSKNIDNVLAGTDEHINMKIHYGDSSLSLFKKCVHEQQFNSSLKNKLEDDTSGAVIWTSPAGTTEINVDIFFYNGLAKYNDAGEVESASVTVKAYYKQKDASDSAYQLIGYFKNGSNTISDSQLKTLRYVVSKSGLQADSYTIKVERETADSDSSMVIDEVYLGSIRAIKNSSPVRSEILQKLCVIELKIKATPKLQNIIEKLNFVSQSYLPIYSKSGTGSSSWTTKALSSNPASVAVFAMQGAMAQQKLKDSDIDWMAFEKLYNWCESHNYECNYFLSESISISQLLTNIATCARCEIFRLNGKITVVQDIEKDSAVQLFTPRNSKNYTETLLKAEIPDCIALKFVNEESGFAEDEVKVYNTSTGNKITEPETTQEVSLWGVTNSKQARKVGMYDLAVFRARSVVHTFQCDFEYMLCSKGDWIKYAGDIALAGLKQGRIENLIYNDNGKIIGFKSDELLPMQEENSYAVRIRKNDGTISLYDIIYTEGNHLEILFSESLQADEIQEQNLFAFGIRGQETIDLIVTSISCQDNLMAEITAVEYAPKIFEVDSPNFTLPDFESNISDIPGVVDSGAVDLSDWKTFYTYNDSSEQPAKPTGNGTENGWHRNSTAQSKWMSSKTSKDVNSGEWSAPSPTGGYVYDQILSEEPKIQSPDAPEFVTAYAEENGIRISCSTKEGIKNSISKYIFEINKGSVWIQKTSQSSEFLYNFDRNSDGYPEGTDLSKWKIRAKVESVYGKESDYSSEIFVNVDTYGTWIPTTPKIDKATNKRQVSMTFSQPITSRILYGEIQYGITIRKQGETTFYTPELDKDPKENVNNYKKSSTNSHFVTSYFSQTLPLSGQNNTKWKKKYHEITQGSSVEKNISTSYLTNINSESIPSNATKEYDSSGNLIKVKFSKSSGSITMYYEYTLVDMPSPVDTTYQYKIIVKNITTNKEYSSLVVNPISLVATANGVGDLVDNAITQNALAPDAVTTEKIAAGAVTAKLIAAENILAKGARAGMVSTEGLQVDDSGFFASEPFNYKYHDPETGAEKSYPTSEGEFFVGNSPDVNDSRDVSEFLHYKKGEGGGFWLKIKNFIVKGLSTIINGVFVVKKTGEADSKAFFVANATDSADSTTGVAGRTVRVNGGVSIFGETSDSVSFSDKNPYIEFANEAKRQKIKLLYTDYDSIQNPASIHLIGEQGGEFLILPNLKITEDAVLAGTSLKNFKNNYYGDGLTMVGLGFTYNQKVSIKDFVSALLKKINTACFQVKFNWYTAGGAYVTDGENEIYMSGGVLLGYTEALSSTWNSCELLWFSNEGVTARISATIYTNADVVTGKISILKSIKETYPTGTIYMSVNSTSPATLFGGYWVRLKDRFLVGANDISGSAFAPGAMAGKSVLTDVPAHTHEISMDSAGVHQHTTAGNNSSVKKGTSYMLGGIGTNVYEYVSNGVTQGAGSHKHNLYIKETGSVGVNILPPYLAVYMWKRVKESEAATLSII